jgi:3-methyladenine DNA glycosylase AlkD
MAARSVSPSSSSGRAAIVRDVLAWLKRRGAARNREGMARYGITSSRVFGVSMATMRPLVGRLGRDQPLAEALWATGWLEARILAGFVGRPDALTASGMDRWARDFDNWAVTDSTCLHLFADSPLAWERVRAWRRRRGEFQRRAAFALLAALAVRSRAAPDARFRDTLPWLVEAARDDRPYVRKAVNWALRQVGKRNLALHRAACRTAESIRRLDTPTARWIAADALRELRDPRTVARVIAHATTAAARHR